MPAKAPTVADASEAQARLIAAGSILGGLAATSCCLLPLVLASVGISGAWIANLMALAACKPYIAAGTLALLGVSRGGRTSIAVDLVPEACLQ